MTDPAAIGYLGPKGTFTEAALLSETDLASARLVEFASMPEVLDAVASGEVAAGFLALENALEGSVTPTLDGLIFDHDLLIQREVAVPIHHALLARPGTKLEQVSILLSIREALAQCRTFRRQQLPHVEELLTTSTAAAAAQVAREVDGKWAAIAPERAGEVYGLEVLAREVEDHPENMTRFVLVARSGLPAPTGHDKTTVVCFQHFNQPGSLLAILQEFAARSINLTRLESRPTKASLGSYCFVIDFEGHVADEVVGDALVHVRPRLHSMKFLGSYPAAGQHTERRQRRARSHLEALKWLATTRGGPPSAWD